MTGSTQTRRTWSDPSDRRSRHRRVDSGAGFYLAFVSPDGRHFLLYTRPVGKPGEIRVGSVDSQETRLVTQAYSRALYAGSGHLLYVREGDLVAQNFDLRTMSVSGTPTVVAQDVLYFRDLGQADFSLSRTGILAYQSGATASRLVWFRRDGTDAGQLGEPADYYFLNLSSDGEKVAVDVMDRRSGTTDLRVFDLARGGQSRRDVGPTMDRRPSCHHMGTRWRFVGEGGAARARSGSRTQAGESWWTLQPCSSSPTGHRPGGKPSSTGQHAGTGEDGWPSQPTDAHASSSDPADDMDGRVGRRPLAGTRRTNRAERGLCPPHGSGDRWQIPPSGGVSPDAA